jgi:hypothetical protein
MSLQRELGARLFGPFLCRRHGPTMSTLLISGLSALPTIPTARAPVPTQAQRDSVRGRIIMVYASNPPTAATTLDLRPDGAREIVGRTPKRAGGRVID